MLYNFSYNRLGDSSSGGPQKLGADRFDCRPERYEIVVYYCPLTPESEFIYQETICTKYQEVVEWTI